jgi:hypothetical protein
VFQGDRGRSRDSALYFLASKEQLDKVLFGIRIQLSLVLCTYVLGSW